MSKKKNKKSRSSSLEGLIRLCVDNPKVETFILVHNFKWNAYSDDRPLTIQRSASHKGKGETPKEAVKNFLLDLDK